MSPNLASCIRAARISEADFHNSRRAGRFADWPEELSRGFAVRLGIFGALRAAGVTAMIAARIADDMAKEPPSLFIRGPLEGPSGTETRVYSNALDNASLQYLFSLSAAAPGRQVIGDGPPDPELDAAPQADVVTIINVPSVIRRMEALFEGAEG